MYRIYQEVYREGEAKLIQAGIDEAALDARLLLEYVCGTDRNTLLAHGDREVTEKEYGCYCDLIVKRAGHIPLQHLTGEQEFMGLTFVVNNKVLVPRQDTEVLVEEALRHLHDGIRILDMCTGSGCILFKPAVLFQWMQRNRGWIYQRRRLYWQGKMRPKSADWLEGRKRFQTVVFCKAICLKNWKASMI